MALDVMFIYTIVVYVLLFYGSSILQFDLMRKILRRGLVVVFWFMQMIKREMFLNCVISKLEANNEMLCVEKNISTSFSSFNKVYVYLFSLTASFSCTVKLETKKLSA